MNVLITGGAGYLGTELVNVLVKEKSIQQIIVYDNLSRNNYNLFLGGKKPESQKIKFIHGDILDTRKLKNEVERADIVFHLAAKVTTPFANHNPHEFDQVNNWGTSELCYLIEKSAVSKFIYISSASVYGASEKYVDNNSTLNPKTFYGISKMRGEEHVHTIQRNNISKYILRLGNIYGYSHSMRFDSVINKFMFEANFMNRIRIYGNGNQTRSYIHVERACNVLQKIAFTDFEPNTYNIVESTYSINEIVDELKKIYLTLEMTFVNQNIKMRSLNVKPDDRIPELIKNDKENILLEDLQEFKGCFSF